MGIMNGVTYVRYVTADITYWLNKTRGTAKAFGHARRVLIPPLREINLPPIRTFKKLSNGAIIEIQRLKHSVI